MPLSRSEVITICFYCCVALLVRFEPFQILALSAWMDLEYIMLSEVSQSEEDNYHMISLICGM